MKNKALLFLPLVTTLLTGCSFSSSLSKEKFQSNFDKVTENMEQNPPTNVTIKDKILGTDERQYKEGEFYTYKYFVVAIILPVDEREATWKEDGKFYHYVYNNISKKDSLTEINESTFNTYMAAHKATIMSMLMEPINTTKDLLNENKEVYKSVSNSYKKDMFSNEFYIKSNVTYETVNGDAKEEHQKTITIKYKDNLPIENTSKEKTDKGTTTNTRKYTYGKATFVNPSKSNDSSQA